MKAICRTCRKWAYLMYCASRATPIFINQCKPCYDAAQMRAKTKGDRKR